MCHVSLSISPAVSLRQAWGAHIDLRDPHFLAFAAAERQFLQAEYEEYAVASSGSMSCFRSVVIIVSVSYSNVQVSRGEKD